MKMGLQDIYLKKNYDSGIDDILKDFYIPSLSNSIKYKRLAGFFSSSSLAVAAKGISNFIKNDGHMELVCSAKLNKEDVESIKNAYKNPKDIIEELALSELENIEEGIVKDHVAALGWMIANNRLKIKIAINLDEDGIPLDESYGMFHLKLGVLIDSEGNMLSFSGSINETEYGWTRNFEEFKIFRNWNLAEKEYFDNDLKTFNRYWDGIPGMVQVFDIPEAVERELIKIAPVRFEDLNIGDKNKRTKKRKALYDHQKNAIDFWVKNNMKGIFAMATGTGKTLTALGCLEKLFKQKNHIIGIISCPYAHLVNQWAQELDDFNNKYEFVIASGSINNKWKSDLKDFVYDIQNESLDKGVIITTHDTLSSENFIDVINDTHLDYLLIVDEVHGIGSQKRRIGLLDNYEYRLGLSATPTRYFDEEGTELIEDYFKGTVYEFSIEDALNTINPDTGDFFLTPYKYKPCFVELTPEEIADYENLTKKLARAYYILKNENEKTDKLNNLLFKRQNIINNAVNKCKTLKEVLNSIRIVDHTLIYCSPKQLDPVRDILDKMDIKPYTKFTMEEGTKKEEKYNGLSEREHILNEFEDGIYKVLVAMRCLDEGVDVPSAKTAIIMSSSSNPREYIQRRGRVLRRSKNKELALIHDFVIFPKIDDKNLSKIEKQIRRKEIRRYKEFARTAMNEAECLSKLQNYLNRGF